MKYYYYNARKEKINKLIEKLSSNKWAIIILIIGTLFFTVPYCHSQELIIDDYDTFLENVYVNWELLDIVEETNLIKKDIVYQILDDVIIVANKRNDTLSLFYVYDGTTKYDDFKYLCFDHLFVGSIETIEELRNSIDFEKLFDYIELRDTL